MTQDDGMMECMYRGERTTADKQYTSNITFKIVDTVRKKGTTAMEVEGIPFALVAGEIGASVVTPHFDPQLINPCVLLGHSATDIV
jgi:hypothetical protein